MQSADYQKVWLSIRMGDENALFSLYNELYSQLYSYGMYVCNTRVIVEDCINELFLEVYDRREKMPEVTNVKSYFFTYLRRKILKEKKQVERPLLTHDNLQQVFEESILENIIQLQMEEEVKQKILKAINELSPRQKQIIILKYYENISYDEIATQLNLSLRTVYNNAFEAIQVLRNNSTLISSSEVSAFIVFFKFLF